HLVQNVADAQPVFAVDNGHGAVRFDGRNQHLLLRDLGLAYSDVTIVAVAAPFSNTGDFRAILALNRVDEHDYQSGVNLDLGPAFYGRIQTLKPEGPGFGGAVNLMKDPSDFGTIRRIALTTAPGAGGVKLHIDGKFQGQRDRADSVIHMNQLTVGARYY